MNIVIDGRKVTQDTKNIGFQKDNLAETINVTVDTPISATYKLDILYPTDCCSEPLYNIIDLSRSGNVCTVVLTANMLPFSGKYTCQFRVIDGEILYHTETFEIWCKRSLDPSEVYTPVPSEFYQIEDRITELNNHPPYPNSTTGYWMIWDIATHSYKQSTLHIGTQLPNIDITTEGRFLTNNGENALWASVPTLPDISIFTTNKILSNNGESAEWIDGGYVFTQSIASSVWNINHNLNKYPSITIVDSGNNIVVGEIKYNSISSITVTFTSAFSGKAYLN